MKIRPVGRLFRADRRTDLRKIVVFFTILRPLRSVLKILYLSKNQWLITANLVHTAICNALTSVVIRMY